MKLYIEPCVCSLLLKMMIVFDAPSTTQGDLNGWSQNLTWGGSMTWERALCPL